MSDSRLTHAQLAIVALSFVVRLIAVQARPAEPVSDAAYYHGIAERLASGRGFVTPDGRPTAQTPPGYPAFLAVIYLSSAPDPSIARLAQALLGTVTVGLLMLLGWRCFDPVAGLLSGLLAAVYPGLVWLPRTLLSENVALPLLLLALWLTLDVADRPTSLRSLALGVTLAAAILVRPASVFLLPLLGLGLLAALHARQGLRATFMVAVFAATGVALVVAPWAYRNHVVFGGGPRLATVEGVTLYASYYPPERAGKRIWGTLPGVEDPVVAKAGEDARNEARASDQLRAVTLARLKEDPLLALRLLPEKLAALLVPLDWELFPHASGTTRSTNYGYVLAGLLAGIGIWASRRAPPRHPWILLSLVVAVLSQAVVFYGSPRFRLPAELVLLLYAGRGMERLVQR